MFIPLGFGSWLRKFPTMIVAITFICTYWSVNFFKVIEAREKAAAAEGSSEKDRILELSKNVVLESCLTQLASKTECERLIAKEFGKSGESSDSKNEPAPSAKNNTAVKQRSSFTESLTQIKNTAEFKLEFQKPIENWPDYVKNSASYQELIRLREKRQTDQLKKSAHMGFLTYKSFSLVNLIRASFTHANYLHLFGNLLMLIVVGVWVEQRMGLVLTALTFVTGSFFGLGFQIWQSPQQSVIGASAGIFAIMGAYFVFFYKSEIRFLFTLFPLYFKRLFLPAAWTFPVFYFVGEFTAAANNENTGIGHFAHIGGLLLGCSVAYFVKQNDALPADQLFNEEGPLVLKMKQSTTSADLWKNFKNVMQWNCQNWSAIAVFLNKSKDLPLDLSTPKDLKFFEHEMRLAAAHFLRYGKNDEILDFINIVPAQVNLASCFAEIPVKLVLTLADQLANEKDYLSAKRLYESTLSRKPNPQQQQSVNMALSSINLILMQTTTKTIGA